MSAPRIVYETPESTRILGSFLVFALFVTSYGWWKATRAPAIVADPVIEYVDCSRNPDSDWRVRLVFTTYPRCNDSTGKCWWGDDAKLSPLGALDPVKWHEFKVDSPYRKLRVIVQESECIECPISGCPVKHNCEGGRR